MTGLAGHVTTNTNRPEGTMTTVPMHSVSILLDLDKVDDVKSTRDHHGHHWVVTLLPEKAANGAMLDPVTVEYVHGTNRNSLNVKLTVRINGVVYVDCMAGHNGTEQITKEFGAMVAKLASFMVNVEHVDYDRRKKDASALARRVFA